MASKSSTAKAIDPILIRPAKFDDLPKLAFTAVTGYAGSTIEKFLSPLRPQYPEDALRSWYQRMVLRWVDPRMVSVVACPASSPEKVVGYAQFSRIGDDEGAKQKIASRKTAWLTLLAWYYTIKFKIVDHFWPDRSANPEAEKQFDAWCQLDDKMHWNPFPERMNRWHLRSIVVSPEWRGKGVGTLLIKEVLDRARKEGVTVGLEASPDGEYLYRKVGFELLSRFYYEEGSPIASPNEGGIMMWKPNKAKSS
jgi:ribosomal protein S18 acetylase RimI-like enzyme